MIGVVGDGLQPLIDGVFGGDLYSQMGKPAVFSGAVPMLHLWRYMDHVAGAQPLRGLAPCLIPSLAAGAQQDLAPLVMDVPVVAAARLKGDVCKKDGLLRIGQRIEEGRAGKILRVGGVFRAPAKDVFLFKCGFILNFRDPYSFPLQSFSNSFATSSSSWRMGRCCGQTCSHLPHFTQSDALRPGAVWTSL